MRTKSWRSGLAIFCIGDIALSCLGGANKRWQICLEIPPRTLLTRLSRKHLTEQKHFAVRRALLPRNRKNVCAVGSSESLKILSRMLSRLKGASENFGQDRLPFPSFRKRKILHSLSKRQIKIRPFHLNVLY